MNKTNTQLLSIVHFVILAQLMLISWKLQLFVHALIAIYGQGLTPTIHIQTLSDVQLERGRCWNVSFHKDI